MTGKSKLLVVDDETPMRRFLRLALEPHDYEIIEACNGREALTFAAAHLPDLVILDVNLPDMDGFKILERLRDWYAKPIIMLSVRNDEVSIVKALDSGANDYLTKPFNLNELTARIRVALRSLRSGDEVPTLKAGHVEIDLAHRQVRRAGVEIKLSATEYDILRVLALNSGKVLTHSQLLKEVWGPNATEHVQYLRVYVRHLRQKIEQDPGQPRIIITEPGIGYRLRLDYDP